MITRTLSLLLGLAALLASPAAAQFGVPKKPPSSVDIPEDVRAELRATGEIQTPHEGRLSPQDAADMEELITKAKADADTSAMVERMKADMKDELEALGKEPAEEILGGMKQALDEIKMLDVLFRDKKRALKMMQEEGMIAKDHLKKYQKNPDLLEEDTRKGLYFQFVSLAVAGGYM
eukprot:CAMPEP_0183306698 /NCGR_PEP_ID=MMETSP0160_2-20130417/13535_1 /TAXON_ID=2839 ORGANISM="Odontella Sinensis, Strain Grunow 1884" /NCGR_SAMPLE_ID=MMETSP0160_2 /ASSEMBLY_ACC=CAM_ASM_000250 /LENGTH=176 /DNA_ID=CAMNT_0025470141 /DNA_START=83 /DNA_END=613 /DNA_ORIENTATION=+